MGELNVYGVYIPIFLIQCIIAYILLKIVMLGTDRLVERGWIAWSSLFNLCVYIVLLFLVHSLFILCAF